MDSFGAAEELCACLEMHDSALRIGHVVPEGIQLAFVT